MDALTFLSEIAKTLVWPLTILCVVLILRKPLRVLLLSLRRIQYEGFSAEFGRQVRALAKKFMKMMPEAVEVGSRYSFPGSNYPPDGIREVIGRSVRDLENAAADSLSKKRTDKTQLELYNKLIELGRMAIQFPEPAPDPHAVGVYLWMAIRMTGLLRS